MLSLAPATIKQYETLEWTQTRELVKLGFSEAEINASSWLVAQKGSAHETASPGRFLLHCTQSYRIPLPDSGLYAIDVDEMVI
jgi:hypothetical protein